MANGDAIVLTLRVVALQADAVIGTIHSAMLHHNLLTISEIDAVIIPEGAIINIESSKLHLATLMERKSPSSTIAQVNTLDADILTIYEIE